MELSYSQKIDFVREQIKDFPDFPKKGILFKDIFSALSSGPACRALHEALVETIRADFPETEAVVGLESRGFLFAFAAAAELRVACVPVRKQGKLPGATVKCSYGLEYGSDVFEVQKDAFAKPGLKCLIVDDMIATGGSMEAAAKLLRQCGAEVVGALTVMELLDLKGREKLTDINVKSLIQY